jgi:hypothetical protein
MTNGNTHIQQWDLHRPITPWGKVMMKTNVILRFAQRALWIYIAEAAIVLAIVILIGIHP